MPGAELPGAELEAGPSLGDLALLKHHCAESGRIARRYFGDDPQVWMKEGDSPVSEADYAVDTYLKRELLLARPDYGWLSEETEDSPEREGRARVFVVDPIDGTRGFLAGDRRWCVSAAVVENNRPTCGVLEVPMRDETVFACAGEGAWLGETRLDAVATREHRPLRIAGPKVFMRLARDVFDHSVEAAPFVPSLAYRIALVAVGRIDVAFARASARDWDLAAADVIAHEAGVVLRGLEGEVLTYNCPSTRHGVLVACRKERLDEMLAVAREVLARA